MHTIRVCSGDYVPENYYERSVEHDGLWPEYYMPLTGRFMYIYSVTVGLVLLTAFLSLIVFAFIFIYTYMNKRPVGD